MPVKTQQKPATVVSQIAALVNNHIETVEAIIKDYSYATEESMDMELRTCLENLKDTLDDFEEMDDAEKFEQLVKELKLISKDDVDPDALIDVITNQDDFDADRLLTLVGTEAITGYLTGKGYCFINLKGNMLYETKLKDFVTTEIYPHYRDQEAYMIM